MSLTINIGSDSGMDAFDTTDDTLNSVTYRPLVNSLEVDGIIDSETNDLLDLAPGGGGSHNTWELNQARTGTVLGEGTYSVTFAPIPEPSSLFLLMSVVALVGLRWRHQRHRA